MSVKDTSSPIDIMVGGSSFGDMNLRVDERNASVAVDTHDVEYTLNQTSKDLLTHIPTILETVHAIQQMIAQKGCKELKHGDFNKNVSTSRENSYNKAGNKTVNANSSHKDVISSINARNLDEVLDINALKALRKTCDEEFVRLKLLFDKFCSQISNLMNLSAAYTIDQKVNPSMSRSDLTVYCHKTTMTRDYIAQHGIVKERITLPSVPALTHLDFSSEKKSGISCSVSFTTTSPMSKYHTIENEYKNFPLKQFITDVYDTLVGRLVAVTGDSFDEFINYNCALASPILDVDNVDTFVFHKWLACIDPVEVIQEHYQSQFGLRNLVDNAWKTLWKSLSNFSSKDADIATFQAFLKFDRPQSELLFYCVCRSLASSYIISPGNSELTKQPVIDANNCRLVIDIPHALAVARRLFRMEDEEMLKKQDEALIEVTSRAYQEFLPSNRYISFQNELLLHVVSASVTPESVIYKLKGKQGKSTSMPSRPRSTRQSNINRFQSREYNTTASRSPLLRKFEEGQQRTIQYGTTTETQWIYFDKFFEVLLCYRKEDEDFHSKVHWALSHLPYSESRSNGWQSFSNSIWQSVDAERFYEYLKVYTPTISKRELMAIFHNSLSQRRIEHEMPPQIFVALVLTLHQQGIVVVPKELNSLEEIPDTASTIAIPDCQTLTIEPSFEVFVERLFHCTPNPTSEQSSSIGVLDSQVHPHEQIISSQDSTIGNVEDKETEIRGASKTATK